MGLLEIQGHCGGGNHFRPGNASGQPEVVGGPTFWQGASSENFFAPLPVLP